MGTHPVKFVNPKLKRCNMKNPILLIFLIVVINAQTTSKIKKKYRTAISNHLNMPIDYERDFQQIADNNNRDCNTLHGYWFAEMINNARGRMMSAYTYSEFYGLPKDEMTSVIELLEGNFKGHYKALKGLLERNIELFFIYSDYEGIPNNPYSALLLDYRNELRKLSKVVDRM